MAEWIASERILTDPLIIPAPSFITIRLELEIIDKRAVLTFLTIMAAPKIPGFKDDSFFHLC